jgi:hypothetical protein
MSRGDWIAVTVALFLAFLGCVVYLTKGWGYEPEHAKPEGPEPGRAGLEATTLLAAPVPGYPGPLEDERDEDDPEGDRFIAALRGEPAPVLPVPPAPPGAAPVPFRVPPFASPPLEPLPPLDRRESSLLPLDAGRPAKPWTPPANVDVIVRFRDALRAWAPDGPKAPEPPAEDVPPTRPEAVAEPAPVRAGDDTQEIFLNLVGGRWDPAGMADDIERRVYGPDRGAA